MRRCWSGWVHPWGPRWWRPGPTVAWWTWGRLWSCAEQVDPEAATGARDVRPDHRHAIRAVDAHAVAGDPVAARPLTALLGQAPASAADNGAGNGAGGAPADESDTSDEKDDKGEKSDKAEKSDTSDEKKSATAKDEPAKKQPAEKKPAKKADDEPTAKPSQKSTPASD